jgi:hypothetical protein
VLILVLRNDGGVVAQDVETTVTFPKGIRLVKDKDYKSLPQPPLPPDIEKENGRWKIRHNRPDPIDHSSPVELGIQI